MVKQRSSLIVLVLLLFASDGFAGDSLHVVSFNSARWFRMENLWLNTGNISGLSFNLDNELTTFEVGAMQKEDDFHLIRQPRQVDRYYFTTSSYQTVNDRFFVAGSFSYDNINEKGARWTGTYDSYRGIPYLLADSLTGVNTHKEQYRLNGQAAWVLSERLILGTGIDYYVAVAAKQKDPRPEITVTFLEFHPSLLLRKEKYKFGFDAGYNNRKEEISYTTYKSNFNPVFFMFKGFGFHSKEIDYDFYRFQTDQSAFGGIQFDKDFRGLSSLLELRGKYSFEKIEDGSSVIIREDGGDWKTWEVEIRENLKKTIGKNIHFLNGSFSFFNGDGVEYTQNVIFTGNHEEYVTISKNLKFNRRVMNGNIAYNFLRMNSNRKLNWNLHGSMSAINNSEKYYYIPEIFTSSWFNLIGKVGIQKNIYSGNFHFAPSVDISYNSNLSNSILLSTLPEIAKNQRPETYLQEFDYYTADVLDIKGMLQIGFTPRLVKIGQINVGVTGDYMKPADMDLHNTFFNVTVGFVF